MQLPPMLILRFIAVGIILLWLNYQLGEHLVKAIIPLYQWVIKQLDYRLDSIVLSIINQHGEQFLMLKIKFSQSIMVGTQVITPNYPITSAVTMPLGNVLLPVVLMFTIVLAWPITANKHVLRTYATRILIALPLCVLIMLLDMPTQLLKMVWESLNEFFNLSISSNLSYFTYWCDFLNGGGLIALSIAAGLFAVGISTTLVKR